MSPPSPSPEESHRALQQIISESPSGTTDLPNLGPPSWTHGFRQMIRTLFERLDELLAPFFQGRKTPFINPETLDATLTACGYFVVFLLALMALWFALRTVKRYAYGEATARLHETHSTLSGSDVERLIEEALRQGDIPKATRLLWKAFIARWGMAPNTTPAEYMSAYPERLPEDETKRLYILMYSGSAQRSDFEACRALLGKGVRNALT